jgi:hypothetical protein
LQETGFCAGEWEPAIDTSEIKTTLCWKIHYPWTLSLRVREVFAFFFILPHTGEETVIGNRDNGEQVYSNFEVAHVHMPDCCSVISYTTYPLYVCAAAAAAENTVVVKDTGFARNDCRGFNKLSYTVLLR